MGSVVSLARGGAGGDAGVPVQMPRDPGDAEKREQLPHEIGEKGDATELGTRGVLDGDPGEAVPPQTARRRHALLHREAERERRERTAHERSDDNARRDDEHLEMMLANARHQAAVHADTDADKRHEQPEHGARLHPPARGTSALSGAATPRAMPRASMMSAATAMPSMGRRSLDFPPARSAAGAAGSAAGATAPPGRSGSGGNGAWRGRVEQAGGQEVDEHHGACRGDEAENEALATPGDNAGEKALPRADGGAHRADEQAGADSFAACRYRAESARAPRSGPASMPTTMMMRISTCVPRRRPVCFRRHSIAQPAGRGGTERHHPTRSRPPRGGFSKMRTARQPAWRRRRPQPSPSAPPLRTQLRHSPRRAPRSVRSRASTSALSLGIGRAERQAARLEEMAARKLPRPKRVVLAVVEVAHPAAAIRRTAEERAVAPVRNRDRGGRATTGEHRPCSRARRRRHTPAIAPPRSRI